MSYSFIVRGSSKDDAKAKLADELAKVVASQPVHAADQAAAQAAAEGMVDVLPDTDEDIQVSVNGSCYANGDGLIGASVSVNVHRASRNS